MAVTINVDIEATFANDCKKFTIANSTDYSNVSGGASGIDSATLKIYRPKDSDNNPYTKTVTSEIQNGTDITVNSSDVGQSSDQKLIDGVWQFVLEVTDSDTSTTETGDDHELTYCELLECIQKRAAKLPNLYDDCGDCHETNVAETFNMYMVYLQTAVFQFQNQAYDNAQDLVDNALTMCEFNCGC